DWFTPYNVNQLNGGDLDLGSSGALLLHGASYDYVIGGGKGGWLYVLDANNLGHFNAGGDQGVQSFTASTANMNPAKHIHGSPIVWDLPAGAMIYVQPEYGSLNGYQLQNGKFGLVTSSAVPAPDGMPGGMLSLSANGTTPGTGII